MEWDCEFISPLDRQVGDLPRAGQLILDAESELIRSEWRALFPEKHFRFVCDRIARMKISDTQYVALFDWTAVVQDSSIENPMEIEDAFLAAFRLFVDSYKQISEILIVCPTFRGVHREYGYFARDVILRRIGDSYWKRRLVERSKRLRVYGWPETWPTDRVLYLDV